jgi:hypothetical protein
MLKNEPKMNRRPLRLYRTLSLIRELKSLNHPYEAYRDEIWLTIYTKGQESFFRLHIKSLMDCYWIHMAKWSINQVQVSYTWELRAATGAELLIKLIHHNILPAYFMPITAKPRTTDEP